MDAQELTFGDSYMPSYVYVWDKQGWEWQEIEMQHVRTCKRQARSVRTGIKLYK